MLLINSSYPFQRNYTQPLAAFQRNYTQPLRSKEYKIDLIMS